MVVKVNSGWPWNLTSERPPGLRVWTRLFWKWEEYTAFRVAAGQTSREYSLQRPSLNELYPSLGTMAPPSFLYSCFHPELFCFQEQLRPQLLEFNRYFRSEVLPVSDASLQLNVEPSRRPRRPRRPTNKSESGTWPGTRHWRCCHCDGCCNSTAGKGPIGAP